MNDSINAELFSAPVQARAAASRARRCALLMSMLACLGAVASTAAMAADPGEQADRSAAADERAEAERERKLDAARKRLDEAAREVAELSRAISEDAMPQIRRVMGRQVSRAMLGVNIGSGRGSERKDGVEIVSVSPGGPASEAGLKSGDVLVEIKGKSLKQEGSQTPHEQLLAIMRDVDPDEKVNVRYLRDGKAATATVVAQRSDPMRSFRIHGMEDLPSFDFMRSHGVFGSAELVTLTPKLGQYFGTDKGLLVVRAPADSRLRLEEGDVILDIDGRVPTSASHALRILSSYQAGEKLKLNVLRMKKRTTFDITIPEDVLEHRPADRPMRMPRAVIEPAPGVPPGVRVAPPPPPPSTRDDTA